MQNKQFEIESQTPFSESLIWKLNRNFYSEIGVSAWRDDIVPHHLTSNARVGKTYAELIYAILKDLANNGKNDEVVYILELGSGHGRLAFHILGHLHEIESSSEDRVPRYCYILSDIVEENLLFFHNHPQFQSYFDRGVLDLSYFDAVGSKEIHLRNSKKRISPQQLTQPILAVANYFFDSIPSELFFIQNEEVSTCSVSISSKVDPDGMNAEKLIENMELTFHKSTENLPVYEEPLQNEILESYRSQLSSTYLFYPVSAMTCLQNIKALSKAGLAMLSMDKGFHELQNLENKKQPDVVKHGSFSLWVNYHALNAYCTKEGGKTLFPTYSNFHLELGCLLFVNDSHNYSYLKLAYQHFVDDFGPDDFNSIKQLAYSNMSRLKLKDLLALYRLSFYDSTFFIKLLPRLKHVYKTITFDERRRLAQTIDCVWKSYFDIEESFDLAYEIGGIFYNLGFYTEALIYFQFSIDSFGQKADVYYNQALCFYQLKDDDQFFKILDEAKKAFPLFEPFKTLENLEME